MENTQFHKHICSIIENHCYDYFENDMEYIIECMMNDPDFELSDEYKISDEYYNNRNIALKIMIDCDDSHFDDYTKYLFDGNRYKISLPTNKDELLKLLQFCKDTDYEAYCCSISNGLIKCYGMYVINKFYGNLWIIKKLHEFADANDNYSKKTLKTQFALYFTEFLQNYDTKKISNIRQVRTDYINYLFSKNSKLKIDKPKSALEYLQIIDYLETMKIIETNNFKTNINNIQFLYLRNSAENLYNESWFLKHIKVRALEIILQNPIIQFHYRDRVLVKQYEREFSNIL